MILDIEIPSHIEGREVREVLHINHIEAVSDGRMQNTFIILTPNQNNLKVLEEFKEREILQGPVPNTHGEDKWYLNINQVKFRYTVR